MITRHSVLFLVLAGLLVVGCDESGFNTSPDECLIPPDQLTDGGVGKDVIPALTNPLFVAPDQVNYLAPQNRVIGMQTDSGPIAIPHNIMWWHEIVNLSLDGEDMAVTYCPLTGSSMAFDRSSVDGAEFGVSGLLFQNNLTMYDRNSNESLWPQMMRQAGCGDRNGARLTMLPVQEMTWEGWLDLHPDTRVLSDRTGHERNYFTGGYPYGNYEEPNNSRLLFAQQIDTRRPTKERVLGIPHQTGGIGLPFGELDQAEKTAVNLEVGGTPLVVLWSRDHGSAMAFRTAASGQELTFEVLDGMFQDVQTRSTWTPAGLAVAGPMEGQRLTPHAEAYIAFWFAWAAFQPGTELWEAG